MRLNQYFLHLSTNDSQVFFQLLRKDSTYFKEEVIVKKNFSNLQFLALLPFLLITICFYLIFKIINNGWHNLLFFLFKEKDLMSREDFKKKHREVTKNMATDKRIFVKKDIPGL